jgi:hypothetical protein
MQKKNLNIGLMFNFAKKKWFDYFRKIKNEEIKIDNKAKKESFLYFITINYPTPLKKIVYVISYLTPLVLNFYVLI